MVECRARPGRRVVAGLARGREKLRLRGMPRIRRVVVIRLMAADAGRGQRRVIIVDVAVGALARGHGMRSGQRKCRVVVVKGGIGPDRRVVAQLALLRKSGRHVIGIGRTLEILEMARDACGAVQAVVIVDVAVGALARGHGMRACELEAGGGVVEGAIAPLHCVVAGFARGRECCCNVVHGRSRVVVVGLVARHAGGAREVVIIIDVTIRALARRHGVRSG